jgi:hypothetical protein
MTQQAQLITPQGEKIALPPYVYVQVMEMLSANTTPRRMARDELQAVIKETRGKYAGGKSMTEALLQMRAEERARERKKDAEFAKRFFSKRVAGTRKSRVRPG